MTEIEQLRLSLAKSELEIKRLKQYEPVGKCVFCGFTVTRGSAKKVGDEFACVDECVIGCYCNLLLKQLKRCDSRLANRNATIRRLLEELENGRNS